MTIQLILIIILGVFLFLLFLKITKAVLKAIIITLLIFLLLFSIIGFTVFKDIKEGSLSENKFIQFFKGKIVSKEPINGSINETITNNISEIIIEEG